MIYIYKKIDLSETQSHIKKNLDCIVVYFELKFEFIIK